MTTLKVVEVLAESDLSWEAAAKTAVATVAKTVRNIRSIYIRRGAIWAGPPCGADRWVEPS